jgi:ribose 5-phosphate isomerase A
MAHDDPLAHAALEGIKPGMCVGLGTGRAAARAIEALALRVKNERLRVKCVATSKASEEQARALGLLVLSMDECPRVDHLFDGADEVDGKLRMIKGRGGAMTREKVVAHAASKRVYLVQRSKVVPRLGHTAPLPVEVLGFGFNATRAALEHLGLVGQQRMTSGGEPMITDNGHPVLDLVLPEGVALDRLREALDAIPGVMGHGLFLSEADEVFVEESERGPVTKLGG